MVSISSDEPLLRLLARLAPDVLRVSLVSEWLGAPGVDGPDQQHASLEWSRLSASIVALVSHAGPTAADVGAYETSFTPAPHMF